MYMQKASMWKRAISLAAVIITVTAAFAVAFPLKAAAAVEPEPETEPVPVPLISLLNYPGVKAFDFSQDPVRGNVSPDVMVEPEYGISFNKLTPDEYFGAPVSTMTDSVTGEEVTGIKLGQDGVKGGCGCIYRNMFTYRGMDIDVKSTYMDWTIQAMRTAFISGGFAHYRWRALWFVEMKHEFFLAGTNIPVNVKGFLTFDDLDNYQGLAFDRNELEDIWVNSGSTLIGYRNLRAGETFQQNPWMNWIPSRNMTCIQSTTERDIASVGKNGYDPEEAAEAIFSVTFNSDVLHTAVIDDDTAGFNLLRVSTKKMIPSAIPEGNSPCIEKTVSDDDEDNVRTNSVRSWQPWTYSISVCIPVETEPGNKYSSFEIRDRFPDELKLEEISIFRDGADASEAFSIELEDNCLRARALNTGDTDFYGHQYRLDIKVSVAAAKAEMLEAGKLNDNLEFTVVNKAQIEYGIGGENISVDSNETETTVAYEKDADIIITKKIKASDLYREHGSAVFLFNLKGETASGHELELNRQITFQMENPGSQADSRGYLSGRVVIEGVPEGTYSCSEHELLRFELKEIEDIVNGSRKGKAVEFIIDSGENCRATFINRKKSWGDYSDSNIVVNRVGLP